VRRGAPRNRWGRAVACMGGHGGREIHVGRCAWWVPGWVARAATNQPAGWAAYLRWGVGNGDAVERESAVLSLAPWARLHGRAGGERGGAGRAKETPCNAAWQGWAAGAAAAAPPGLRAVQGSKGQRQASRSRPTPGSKGTSGVSRPGRQPYKAWSAQGEDAIRRLKQGRREGRGRTASGARTVIYHCRPPGGSQRGAADPR
jgi:hypothetical protein